jgi:hypothetical protein
MIKALVAGWPRGGSRVWLALAVGALLPLVGLAQSDGPREKAKGKGAEATEKEAPAAKEQAKESGPAAVGREQEQKEQSAVDPTTVQKRETIETWKDPNVEAALKNTFPELGPVRPLPTQADEEAIKRMASGQADPDRGLIQRYVRSRARELTLRRTIENLLDTNGKGDEVRKIEEATTDLIAPLDLANDNRATRFREDYTKELVQTLRPLLSGHYFTRLEAMVVLSKSGDRQAIRLFNEVLKDPKQVLAVKERAAVGLMRVAQRQNLNTPEAVSASQALAEFLQNEPDAFWPAKVRALEALGALRQVTVNPLQSPADFATLVLKYLADPKARTDVRARAGWALGMLQFSGLNAKYNFPLVGYHLGQAAVDIGTRIVAADADNSPDRARHLTSLLLPLIESFRGDPSLAGSGLLNLNHPSLASSRPFLQQVEQQIREIAKAAIELDKAPVDRIPKNPAQAKKFQSRRAPYRAALTKQVNELKAFLQTNAPKDRSLVPGGPEFPGPAQVAAGARPKP